MGKDKKHKKEKHKKHSKEKSRKRDRSSSSESGSDSEEERRRVKAEKKVRPLLPAISHRQCGFSAAEWTYAAAITCHYMVTACMQGNP